MHCILDGFNLPSQLTFNMNFLTFYVEKLVGRTIATSVDLMYKMWFSKGNLPKWPKKAGHGEFLYL